MHSSWWALLSVAASSDEVLLPSQVQKAKEQVPLLFDNNDLTTEEDGCSPDSGGNSRASIFYSSATPLLAFWAEVFGRANVALE